MTPRETPLLALLIVLAAACTPTAPEPAELVLLGGRLVTVDSENPIASALAARDGLIVAVGDDAEVRRLIGDSTRVIDLEGRLAIPGFIEGHGHFTGIGASLMNIDLRDAPTWEATIERVAAAAADRPAGEWILGWGWHQEKWEASPQPTVEGYPTHDALSRAVPDHPVLLKHAAGSHAGLVNRRAMELAGIDEATPDPAGGTILRDADGRPTGVLRETAYGLALAAYEATRAALSDEQRDDFERREALLASRACLERGVTSFQDAGSSFRSVDLLRELAAAQEIGVRLWIMLGEPHEALAARAADYRAVGDLDERFTVRAIKVGLDGALGSHGAWLLEPYSDFPESHGLNTTPIDELEAIAEFAVRHDLQLCVHAIGDRANRETLDVYAATFARHPDKSGLRWRIEHAQHLHPDDIPRFAELGVVASMQGVHCTSDGPWVPQRLGARRCAEGAYVWRKLLDSGAVISNGTDAPVEDIDPIANFHASVTRLMSDGERFYPDQRMTREEALRSATLDAAYAAFEDDRKGSLTPGKLADVVVLSRDILTVPEEEIREAEVVYTIVGGAVAYEKR